MWGCRGPRRRAQASDQEPRRGNRRLEGRTWWDQERIYAGRGMCIVRLFLKAPTHADEYSSGCPSPEVSCVVCTPPSSYGAISIFFVFGLVVKGCQLCSDDQGRRITSRITYVSLRKAYCSKRRGRRHIHYILLGTQMESLTSKMKMSRFVHVSLTVRGLS